MEFEFTYSEDKIEVSILNNKKFWVATWCLVLNRLLKQTQLGTTDVDLTEEDLWGHKQNCMVC